MSQSTTKECSGTATTAQIPVLPLSAGAVEWLEGRGIDPETAARYGVGTATHPAIGPSLAFPFFREGRRANTEYRSRDKQFRRDDGGESWFWNDQAIDQAVAEDRFLVIAEGPLDAMSVIEAGYPWVVSIKAGAAQKPTEGEINPDDDAKFSEIWNSWERLKKVRRIIVACDNDAKPNPQGFYPGKVTNDELVKRLGRERCLELKHPDGRKDINDILMRDGKEAVIQAIADAVPAQIPGLYRFSDFSNPQSDLLLSAGFGAEFDELLKIPMGKLIVITGIPRHGKSAFADNLVFNLCWFNQMRACVATFESEPKPYYYRDMVDRTSRGRGSEEWIEDTFRIIGQNGSQDEDLDLTMDQIIDLARVAVIRDACKILLLDPWNEIEHRRRPGESEDQYISRALRQLTRFARSFGVLVIVVAHPNKPRDGWASYKEPPSLYQINGSANWFNKAHIGITVHRDSLNDGPSRIITGKVKRCSGRDRWGVHGEALMNFDPHTKTFNTVRIDTA